MLPTEPAGSQAQKTKPGEIASLIRSNYHIEPVSHLTCVGAGKEEIRRTLDHLKANGISNVLALRGDLPADTELSPEFRHASDLIRFIRDYDPQFNLWVPAIRKGIRKPIHWKKISSI